MLWSHHAKAEGVQPDWEAAVLPLNYARKILI